MGWAALVAASPPWFFSAAAPFSVLWIALSAAAAPPGGRPRVRTVDVALGVMTAAVLYAGTRAFLWAFCGGVTDALCAPLADMFRRFHTRAVLPAIALALLIAPAEEAFWRGVVQARAARRLGAAGAIAVATGAAVGLALLTGEPFLALATAPTYAAFGALAAWRGSLVPAVVCHSVWSLLVASVAPP